MAKYTSLFAFDETCSATVILSGPQENYPSLIRQNALRNNTGNPRLPPYPHPTALQPLAQLKQALSIPGLSSASSSSSSVSTQSPSHSASPKDGAFSVCSTFSPQRLCTSAMERRGQFFTEHNRMSDTKSINWNIINLNSKQSLCY